ncbi:MAG: hypothetical protein A2V64_12425 [Bacteroidetes bacterium RBG_13_43_22]|nr:MAG: hypothetical protein A2V64_12425 [Bacteroidetes bacterium RBG_13_43_22]
MKKISLIFLAVFLINPAAEGQANNLFINANTGNDQNTGTKEQPLKTLNEAAKRVNQANGTGAVTIYLSEGIYGLNATAIFQPVNWQFTKEERLTIRAAVLPDDPEWNPAKMPVIISTMPLELKPNGREDPLGGRSYGIQIETNHVTIQGLRVFGSPLHERPAEGMVRRNYPIVREGRDLEDLRITQCLFLGDKHVIPNHLAILASGQNIVVDHCVFYHCKDAVVFWFSDRPAENCEMHHNLMIGNYGAAVWSWSVAEDFKYFNNVVANTNIFWVLHRDEERTMSLSNSLVIGYNELVNKGGGAGGLGEKGNPDKLKFGKDVIIKKEGTVQIEEDPTKRNYLHLVPGTQGADLRAGLFTK